MKQPRSSEPRAACHRICFEVARIPRATRWHLEKTARAPGGEAEQLSARWKSRARVPGTQTCRYKTVRGGRLLLVLTGPLAVHSTRRGRQKNGRGALHEGAVILRSFQALEQKLSTMPTKGQWFCPGRSAMRAGSYQADWEEGEEVKREQAIKCKMADHRRRRGSEVIAA